MTDERYKKIMADLGMPNSTSLLLALQLVANEAAQEAAERERKKMPSLDPVILWLENGCNPLAAARELEIYKERMRSNEQN